MPLLTFTLLSSAWLNDAIYGALGVLLVLGVRRCVRRRRAQSAES